MTTVYRTRPRTWRERLALRLIGTTPLIANVEIGPEFGCVRGRDDRDVLTARVAFDLSEYDREIASGMVRAWDADGNPIPWGDPVTPPSELLRGPSPEAGAFRGETSP